MEDDETELLDPTEVKEQEPEEVEQEPEQSEEPEAEQEPESDEVVVTIGDEPEQEEEPQERAPEWIRDLRKRNQETIKENRELKKRLESLQTAPVEQAGAEPSLESCEYDEEKFKAEWKAWNKRQADRDEQERKKQEAGAKAETEWQEKVNAYEKGKTTLKVKDMAEAEADAFEFLNVTQRGVILDATDNPALVVYAMGKNPKKAQELAAITNPIKFAVAIHDLEKSMKVTPRKTAPLPESTVRGNARVSAGIDSTLERLRAEADRTGDRTKVAAYMRQAAAKKRA